MSPTAKRHDGTGLGLHISRGLADLLDADLYFGSEFGEGTTFVLDLPERTSDD